MMMRMLVTLMCLMTLGIAKAQNADALMKQVADKLSKVRDYKAQAVLKTNVSFIRIPQSEVDVYFKSPDKFRIKKEGGISVLPKGGVGVNLNSILANNNFTAVPGGEASLNGAVLKVVRLLPQDQNADVVLTTLYIDDKNYLIRKATTTTRDNGTYEMEMEYGRFASWGLPDKVIFTFNTKEYHLPKGMTLEYEGGTKPPANNAQKDQKGKIEVHYKDYSINKGVDDSIFK